MVAAWMSAETGVGPSIASGSQTWNGNMADLPMQPAKRPTTRTKASHFEISCTPLPLMIEWTCSEGVAA